MRNNPATGRFRRPQAGGGITLFAVFFGCLLLLQGSIPASPQEVHSVEPHQKPTPDSLMTQSITEKEALAARMEAAANSGRAEPADKSAFTAPPLPNSVSPAFREGIYFGESGPFYSGEVVIENLWQGKVAGRFYQIFAGAYAEDPSQGVVILLITEANRRTSEATWFPTPEKVGAVQVLNRREGTVLVGSDAGAEFTFDFVKLAYVLSP